MRLIGISGPAGCGKDTAADYLVSKYGFTKVSFASILKEMLRVAGLPEPVNRDDKEKNVPGFNFTWRHAAQCLGTEYGRVCLGESIWVDLTMRNLDEDGSYVFSDVRFDNEAMAIRNAYGTILHIRGRGVDLGASSGHASEKGVLIHRDDWVYDNSGSLEGLYIKLANLSLGSTDDIH